MEPCCEKPENRSEPEQLENGIMVQRCLVCLRRHFELTVDPGEIGVKVADLRGGG